MPDYSLLSSMGNHSNAADFIRADGAALYREDGSYCLNLMEMTVILGQQNTAFQAAMQDALSKNTGMKGNRDSLESKLYQYLDETTNHDFSGCHLTTSGSEAVEDAVLIARRMTGKREIISFTNSIHGRTALSASLSGVPARTIGLRELAPGVIRVPYPGAPFYGERIAQDDTAGWLELIKQAYYNTSARCGAAVIVEPIQGADIRIPPAGYLKALQDWAHENEMLFIMDEVQTGMGRTGSWYRYQTEGLKPDILLLGKALGNGLHIAAVLVKNRPPTDLLPALAGGAGNDPLGCAAACEVFRQLEDGLLQHIASLGKHFLERLKDVCEFNSVKEIRGSGLMAAVEFKNASICGAVFDLLSSKGFSAGHRGNTIFFKPPYVITEQQMDTFADTLKQILQQMA